MIHFPQSSFFPGLHFSRAVIFPGRHSGAKPESISKPPRRLKNGSRLPAGMTAGEGCSKHVSLHELTAARGFA
jgi:hypothetical protein